MHAAQNTINFAKAANNSIAGDVSETPLPAGCGWSGLLTLDSQAHICFCSESLAALAGITPLDLVGKPVKTLLPALPLNNATPGYNLAFAAFHGASRRAHVSRLIKSDGTSIAVSVLMNVLRVNREYLFSLEVREPPRNKPAFLHCV